ncbi:MAG: hypothetical protein ACRDZX_14630 [Acidimicrobiales bacterium]
MASNNWGGIGWLSSLRAPQIAALAEAGALQMNLFDEVDLVEIAHPGYPGERRPLRGADKIGLRVGQGREQEEDGQALQARHL